jgi:hypothetical protein
VAGGQCSGGGPGDLPRPYRADAMAAPQRLQQGVRVCALPRGHWNNDGKVYRGTLPYEGRRKPLHPGVRGLRRAPKREVPVKNCRPDPQRERHANLADALCPRESGACPVEPRQRGVGGSRQDEPVQRAQLPDNVC